MEVVLEVVEVWNMLLEVVEVWKMLLEVVEVWNMLLEVVEVWNMLLEASLLLASYVLLEMVEASLLLELSD